MPGRAFSVLISFVALFGLSTAHAAETRTSTVAKGPKTEIEALAMARAAFEYRDFAVVVRTLEAWVHPPRILDPERMVEARRLLGVSLHVEGDERGAREEFAQLLLLDPGHRLDPFVVPPRVIATFEDVRQQLSPRLEEPSTSPRVVRTEIVEVPHPAVIWLPFGVSQATLDEPASAAVLGGLQALGLALNIVGFLMADQIGGDNPDPSAQRDFNTWVTLQYAGLGTFAAAYGASVVQGSFLVERRQQQSRPARTEGSILEPRATWVRVGIPF